MRATTASSFERINPGPNEVGEGEYATGDTSWSSVGMSLAVGTEGFAARCPNSIGDVPGHARFRMGQSLSVSKSGSGGATVFSLDARAKTTGHVGQDGTLSSFDMVVNTTVVFRAAGKNVDGRKASASKTYTSSVAYFHIVPGESISQVTAETNSNVISRSQRGAEVNLELLEAIGAAAIESYASGAFKAGQTVWYDQAACLKAEFKPDSLDKLKDEQGPVKVTVKSLEDGRPVTLYLDAKAAAGKVNPGRARAAAQPATLIFTWDHKDRGPYVHVEGVSERGRAEGTIDGNVTPAVTFTGRGTYTEQDKTTMSSSTTTYNYTDTFTFSNHFLSVYLRPGGLASAGGADSGTLSGSADSNGRDQPNPGTDSSFTCSGTLRDNNQLAPGQLTSSAAGPDQSGVHTLTFAALSHLTADPSAGNCTTTGTSSTESGPTWEIRAVRICNPRWLEPLSLRRTSSARPRSHCQSDPDDRPLRAAGSHEPCTDGAVMERDSQVRSAGALTVLALKSRACSRRAMSPRPPVKHQLRRHRGIDLLQFQTRSRSAGMMTLRKLMTHIDRRRRGGRGRRLTSLFVLSTTCLLCSLMAGPAGATGPAYPGETLSVTQNGPSVSGAVTNFLATGQQADVNNYAGGFGLEVYAKDPRVDPACAADYPGENNASLNDPSERQVVYGEWLGSDSSFSQPFKVVFSRPGPVLLCAYVVWVTDTAASAHLAVNVLGPSTGNSSTQNQSLAQRANAACKFELKKKGKARFDAKYGSKHAMKVCAARWIRHHR